MEENLFHKQAYQQNVQEYSKLLNRHKKKRSSLGWMRLASVIAIAIAAYYGFQSSVLTGVIIAIVGIAEFLFLVKLDAKNDEQIFYYEKLSHINNDELNILEGHYDDREDGLTFLPHEHPYASDMDLFGPNSIYQYINRSTSEQGKKLIAESLLAPSSKQQIIERQEAAIELRLHLHWRQQLQFKGIANPVSFNVERKLLAWSNSPMPYHQKYWKLVAAIFPIITLGSVAAFVFNLIPFATLSLLLFVFYITSIFISRKIEETYTALSTIEKEVGTIYHLLQHFETLDCKSPLLTSLQHELQGNGKAYESILTLKSIINRFDFKLNAIANLLLNTFLLWDLKQVLQLNKWKESYATSINKWFSTMASLELINTLATLTYNHPAWVFPAITDKHFTLDTSEIGHPLIPGDKRVDNSFETEGTGEVSIITGSNMAGKSTFLRSIGVNLVLAQMGAPVCAKRFVFSPVRLYTSMRVSDNLADNTSTFYAELKKLKSIIEEVNKHERVFLLLDEILRGTNSFDKHKGSEALIRQLINKGAVAVIATHDVELGNMKDEYNEQISNYYFDVQVAGEELYFDYKIKSGICQSMNASLLMKKIGIEIADVSGYS
jgi:hypothetical protein